MSNKSTAEYKTIAQIEAETDASQIRGSSSLNYVRELALTQFIREVESQNEDFKLKSAYPAFTVSGEKPPIFSMGLWVTFSIGEVFFALSINENVYFPVSFSKSYPYYEQSYRIDYKRIEEYADLTNVGDTVYAGWNHSTKDEAIPLIKDNLHTAFAEVKNRKVRQYIQETPIYRRDREEEQVIYTY